MANHRIPSHRIAPTRLASQRPAPLSLTVPSAYRICSSHKTLDDLDTPTASLLHGLPLQPPTLSVFASLYHPTRVFIEMSSNYESGYDPYTPGGGHAAGGSSSAAGNNKTAHIQAQIDETVGVMRDNIQKVNERGENLNDLQGKTGE